MNQYVVYKRSTNLLLYALEKNLAAATYIGKSQPTTKILYIWTIIRNL